MIRIHGLNATEEKGREPQRITIIAACRQHNTRLDRKTKHNTRAYVRSSQVKPQKGGAACRTSAHTVAELAKIFSWGRIYINFEWCKC